MKKILSTLLLTILLVSMLLSCQRENGAENTSNSTTGSGDNTIEEQPPAPPSDENEPAPPISLSYWEETREKNCYPTVDAGAYYGKDFEGIIYGEYMYRIIDNYDEFCTLTEKGSYFSRALFDGSAVLAICSYGRSDRRVMGYSDFAITDENASIIAYKSESDFDGQNLGATVKTEYVKIPRELLHHRIIGGNIAVCENTAFMLDYAVLDGKESNIRDGSVWLVEASGLNALLSQQGISGEPSWGRYNDYSDKEYKILVICHTAPVSEGTGYSGLSVNEHSITIERTYVNSGKITESKVIELIAIPNEELTVLTGKNPYLLINNAELVREALSAAQRVEETQVTELTRHQYYDFLDLGIFYYESEMPEGSAYRIIHRYAELEALVEKPFVNESIFDENYIVVLRVNGYVPASFYGIRDLRFNNEGVLFANAEYGGRTYSNEFQSEICYVVVPRDGFNYHASPNGNGHQIVGKLNITVSDYWSRGEYYSYTEKAVEGYPVKENTSWIIKNEMEARDFEEETGVPISRYLVKDKFLFVYYTRADSRAQFEGFLSNESNVYINMSRLYSADTNESRYFIVPIALQELKCTSPTVTAHVFLYQQNKATSHETNEGEVEYYDSFYASHYEGQTLQRVPEFTYMIIKNQSEYERVLTHYTSYEAFPVVSFENNYVLAYYVYEGCTGCDGASYFGNFRYANGRVYLDHYKKGHSGGDAMNPTLYFILIDKAKLDKEISNVYLIEKENYSYEDEYIGEIPSEYEAYIFSTAGGLKGKPDFEYKIVTSYEELCTLYEMYTYLRPTHLQELDFEAMCILAVYYTEPSSAWVHGGFKNMRVANNVIYLTKYYPERASDGDLEILYDCLEHPTLHFIIVEKTFIPEEITDIIILKEATEG